MGDGVNLPLILLAALMNTASPGPATLTIAGTAMAGSRRHALALASGITAGSLAWSTAAALGFGALMLANAWLFEALRYAGAAYLLWLAWRSARAAADPTAAALRDVVRASLGQAWLRGLALHLTNPKAILFFGALYAVGVPHGTPAAELATVIAAVGLQSVVVFHFYALLFSHRRVADAYLRARRWFDGAFALAFGAAGVKVLTTRLQ